MTISQRRDRLRQRDRDPGSGQCGLGLVPQRATWLGLVGGPLIIVSGTIIIFTGNDPSDGLHSLQAIVTIPEFAWELFLGIYCTIWGFRRDAPILSGSAR